MNSFEEFTSLLHCLETAPLNVLVLNELLLAATSLIVDHLVVICPLEEWVL